MTKGPRASPINNDNVLISVENDIFGSDIKLVNHSASIDSKFVERTTNGNKLPDDKKLCLNAVQPLSRCKSYSLSRSSLKLVSSKPWTSLANNEAKVQVTKSKSSVDFNKTLIDTPDNANDRSNSFDKRVSCSSDCNADANYSDDHKLHELPKNFLDLLSEYSPPTSSSSSDESDLDLSDSDSSYEDAPEDQPLLANASDGQSHFLSIVENEQSAVTISSEKERDPIFGEMENNRDDISFIDDVSTFESDNTEKNPLQNASNLNENSLHFLNSNSINSLGSKLPLASSHLQENTSSEVIPVEHNDNESEDDFEESDGTESTVKEVPIRVTGALDDTLSNNSSPTFSDSVDGASPLTATTCGDRETPSHNIMENLQVELASVDIELTPLHPHDLNENSNDLFSINENNIDTSENVTERAAVVQKWLESNSADCSTKLENPPVKKDRSGSIPDTPELKLSINSNIFHSHRATKFDTMNSSNKYIETRNVSESNERTLKETNVQENSVLTTSITNNLNSFELIICPSHEHETNKQTILHNNHLASESRKNLLGFTIEVNRKNSPTFNIKKKSADDGTTLLHEIVQQGLPISSPSIPDARNVFRRNSVSSSAPTAHKCFSDSSKQCVDNYCITDNVKTSNSVLSDCSENVNVKSQYILRRPISFINKCFSTPLRKSTGQSSKKSFISLYTTTSDVSKQPTFFDSNVCANDEFNIKLSPPNDAPNTKEYRRYATLDTVRSPKGKYNEVTKKDAVVCTTGAEISTFGVPAIFTAEVSHSQGIAAQLGNGDCSDHSKIIGFSKPSQLDSSFSGCINNTIENDELVNSEHTMEECAPKNLDTKIQSVDRDPQVTPLTISAAGDDTKIDFESIPLRLKTSETNIHNFNFWTTLTAHASQSTKSWKKKGIFNNPSHSSSNSAKSMNNSTMNSISISSETPSSSSLSSGASIFGHTINSLPLTATLNTYSVTTSSFASPQSKPRFVWSAFRPSKFKGITSSSKSSKSSISPLIISTDKSDVNVMSCPVTSVEFGLSKLLINTEDPTNEKSKCSIQVKTSRIPTVSASKFPDCLLNETTMSIPNSIYKSTELIVSNKNVCSKIIYTHPRQTQIINDFTVESRSPGNILSKPTKHSYFKELSDDTAKRNIFISEQNLYSNSSAISKASSTSNTPIYVNVPIRISAALDDKESSTSALRTSVKHVERCTPVGCCNFSTNAANLDQFCGAPIDKVKMSVQHKSPYDFNKEQISGSFQSTKFSSVGITNTFTTNCIGTNPCILNNQFKNTTDKNDHRFLLSSKRNQCNVDSPPEGKTIEPLPATSRQPNQPYYVNHEVERHMKTIRDSAYELQVVHSERGMKEDMQEVVYLPVEGVHDETYSTGVLQSHSYDQALLFIFLSCILQY